MSKGLLITKTPLDCTKMTTVPGFSVDGTQPENTDRRVVFSIDKTAVKGARTYPITTNAVAADTVTINGITFTAIASGATGNQFNVGSTTTITATNLAATLNANATISALYMATTSANTVILTEKISAGNTPTVATKTGTIVIGTGTVTVSAPDGVYYKLSGSGAMTLTPVNTQVLTTASVLSEGNTIAELQAATNIAEFVGKSVWPAIALYAAPNNTAMPTLKLGIVGQNISDQLTKTVSSPEFLLSTEAVEIIDLSAQVTTSDGAAAEAQVSLLQSGTWSNFMPLSSARRQKATSLKFQANYSVATIGTGSAKISKVTALYRSNNAVVSGETAEIVSVTEDFENGMRYGRIFVKHQRLRDAAIKTYISMRSVPKTRERIPIVVGSNGQRLTATLGVKDAQGNVVPDSGVNHNTIRIWYGSQEVFDFDFNTEMSQVSVTPADGVTVFASYGYGWEPETWIEMQKGSTQEYDDNGTQSTAFSYVLPSNQEGKGVSSMKALLIKPGGHEPGYSLGTATGKTQMTVLPHAAKTASIVMTASAGTAPVWSYDYDSRILTFVAQKDTAVTIDFDWVAETPLVYGFVSSWNE